MDLYDEGGGSFLPPSSTPRDVAGGIRLQRRRGGEQWWTRRWLAALEAGAVGERLAQGLDDARRGRVLELDVDLGGVRALVQGTRRAPHEATVRLGEIDQLTWLRIAQAIASKGASRAELLAGQMPDAVEAAFRREGRDLFPVLEDDVQLACSCEDWSAPCRHVLAACLVLGEAMDADPLLAFRLRGIEPELLMAIVSGDVPGVVASPPVDGEDDDGAAPPPSPQPGEELVVRLDQPPIDAPLVRILGAPPMWRGADSFEPSMRRLYTRVAADPRTVDLALR